MVVAVVMVVDVVGGRVGGNPQLQLGALKPSNRVD